MLQGNGRDDGKDWGEDVGRIDRTTHAAFDDRDIRSFGDDKHEGDEGLDLESGKIELLEVFEIDVEEVIESLLGDSLAIKGDHLAWGI